MGKRLTFGAYPLPLFRHKPLRVAQPEEEEMSDHPEDRLHVGAKGKQKLSKQFSALLSENAALRAKLAAVEKEPTEQEISLYRDMFRAELNRRMDLSHPSTSPSTEAHGVALRQFVRGRIAAAKETKNV